MREGQANRNAAGDAATSDDAADTAANDDTNYQDGGHGSSSSGRRSHAADHLLIELLPLVWAVNRWG